MGKLRIISYSSEPFRNREEAGRILAGELTEQRGQKAVVLGIPRGGVVIASELARSLEAALDVVLSRKLRSPGHPELAMGSVSEDGRMFLNEMVVSELGVSDAYIQKEKELQLSEIRRRRELFRQFVTKIPLKGRVVIITDDGVATGATTQAAIWSARQERPKWLIAAIPVGSQDTVRKLAEDVDDMVCLWTPPFFAAVGQFYARFDQVEDQDVLKILKEARNI